MNRLIRSIATALALTLSLSSAASAYDWTILGGDQNVYASTTRLPLVAVGDCDCAADSACVEACDNCGCDCIGNWYDNTAVFVDSDGWKGIGEAPAGGWHNSFGYRTGFNTGLQIMEGSSIRAQVGASWGLYDLNGRALSDGAEQQIFFTSGIYKRSNICCGDRISWGVVYDYLNDNHWGFVDADINVGQVRGIFGYAWDEVNEFGVWAAFRADDDIAVGLPGGGAIRAQDQVNSFWHHTYEFGGDTTFYVGWADDPGAWTFGAYGQAPLSCNLAIFGGTNYVISERSNGSAASITDLWNVSIGLVYYFGGKAENPSVSGHQGLPLLPVADNGTFAVQDGF